MKALNSLQFSPFLQTILVPDADSAIFSVNIDDKENTYVDVNITFLR
jgi:hypothetical protein